MSNENLDAQGESLPTDTKTKAQSDISEQTGLGVDVTRRNLLSGGASASIGLLGLRITSESANAVTTNQTTSVGRFTPNLNIENFRIASAMVEPGGSFEIEFDLINHESTKQSAYAIIYGYPDRESFSRYDIDPTSNDATWGTWLTVEADESRHFEFTPSVGLDWPKGVWEAKLLVREEQKDRFFDTIAQQRFGFAVGTDYSSACKRAVQRFEGAINSNYQSGYYFANARDEVADSCNFNER